MSEPTCWIDDYPREPYYHPHHCPDCGSIWMCKPPCTRPEGTPCGTCAYDREHGPNLPLVP